MNCKDVEAVVNDLARDQIMDAGLREAALAHAGSCSGCAIQLDDARSLTGALRWLASADENQEAPARLETLLVSQFREHHTEIPRIPVRSARTATQRWLYIAAGIAAAAAIVMLISLIASRSQNSAPIVPQQAVAPPSSNEKQQPALPHAGLEARHVAVGNPNQRLIATKRPRVRKPNADSTHPGGEQEIATDFIRLVSGESLTGLDNAQLVRVELPRSAMMSFGLPMDMDRANERVKADVVMGQDGLARAIRFVR